MVDFYRKSFENNANVEDLDTCWEWKGSTRGAGYGQCSEYVHPSRIASRAMYELCCGPIEDGWVLHTCDNVLCVNPSHLFLGTPHDNTHDMMAKGRLAPHEPGRKYNTEAALGKLSELYTSEEYRKEQGERIRAGQIAAEARNQRNVRQFAFMA